MNYKDEPKSFDVSIRDPWEWALEIVRSPTLCHRINWDPVRNYIWDGNAWEHFIDEPWTGDLLWEAQVFSWYSDRVILLL